MSNSPNFDRKKRRDTGKRKQSNVFIIVGDGESERIYFDRLSNICSPIKIKSYATAKTGEEILIRKASGYAKDHDVNIKDDDVVAIVMDLDNRFSIEQIQSMDKTCAKKRIQVVHIQPFV